MIQFWTTHYSLSQNGYKKSIILFSLAYKKIGMKPAVQCPVTRISKPGTINRCISIRMYFIPSPQPSPRGRGGYDANTYATIDIHARPEAAIINVDQDLLTQIHHP